MLAFFVSTAGHFPIVRRPNPVFGRFSHKAVRTAKYIRARKTKKGTNMKRCVINSFISALACLASFACPTASAQFVRSATGATQVADADSVWTLDECINYALKNNITLKQNVNNYLSGLEDTQRAKSGYSPTLSANAAVGSTNVSGAGTSMAEQIKNNMNESLGLTLSIPIFQGRKTKTAVNKAKIAADNAVLSQQSTEKALLKEIEDTYLNAVSYQAQYLSAKEQASYAQQSYELTSESFQVGKKNTVELITAENSMTSAKQQVLQSKYMTLMNLSLLDIYQGKYDIENK